jgi:hypothetical protein
MLDHPQAYLDLSPPVARAVLAVLGVALIAAGRRLFWLAVAALGFVAGLYAIERWAPQLPRTTELVVALAAGILGLILALVVQKAAVALAGFLLGVIVLTRLLPLTGLDPGAWTPLVLAVGGVLCAVLALAAFGLALSVVTAGAGAALLVDALAPPAQIGAILLVVLWVIGVLLQNRRGKAT